MPVRKKNGRLPIARPKTRKGSPTVKVDLSAYEQLVVRSRTLALIGKGGGKLCDACERCLMVDERCPDCGNAVKLAED